MNRVLQKIAPFLVILGVGLSVMPLHSMEPDNRKKPHPLEERLNNSRARLDDSRTKLSSLKEEESEAPTEPAPEAPSESNARFVDGIKNLFEAIDPASKEYLRNLLSKAKTGSLDAVTDVSAAIGKGFFTGIDSKEIADKLGDSFARGIGNASEQGINGLFNGLEKNTQKGQQLDRTINNVLGNLTKGGTMLTKLTEVMDDSTDELVGAGERNLKKGLQSFSNQFKEGGDAREAFKKPFDMLQEEIKQGSARKAGQEMLNFAKDASDQMQRNLQKNLLYWGGVTGLSVALCCSGYYGNKVFWEWVNRSLKRPKLIIESSYRNPFQKVSDFVMWRTPAYQTQPMVFDSELESRMNHIVEVTKNITKRINEGKKNVKYRNLMLYGPPGTGKTMFAKQLAYRSGMEFAMMSGSSFSKFKKGEGIIAMDELFAWAKKSKGLMIFIDEAESFLSKRENMKTDSEKYEILNNFLNYTGERSDKFMIVFATNHMDRLDSAMHRRIDDLVEMPLPKVDQRERVLKLYRDRILMNEKQNNASFIQAAKRCMTDLKIREIAQKTEGLSNGDLEGIINTIQTDSDITSSGLLTAKVVDTAVERAINKLKSFKKATDTETQEKIKTVL